MQPEEPEATPEVIEKDPAVEANIELLTKANGQLHDPNSELRRIKKLAAEA